MLPSDLQAEIREDIFRWLEDKRASGIEEMSRAELAGYRFGELQIPLVDRNRGIRNPVDFDATLSILHSADGPYDDLDGGDGLLHYAYREGDPRTGDNRKLRRAMDLRAAGHARHGDHAAKAKGRAAVTRSTRRAVRGVHRMTASRGCRG